MKRRLFSIVCLLLGVAAGALAQHWTVNPHAFQYDMTAYVSLKNMTSASQLADYELAAFCGEECRGVGKVLTATDGTSLFQLRIRSNVTTGETITLCIYQKSADKEYYPSCWIDFETQTVAGTPSEPIVVEVAGLAKKGDANGDGVINIADVTAIINHINGSTSGSFVLSAADANGDGSINIADVTAVINIINQ